MDIIYGKVVEGERGHGCRAPHSLFKAEWSDVPKHIQDMVPEGGLGCDGGGHAGLWCMRGLKTCQWYVETEVETEISTIILLDY